MAKVENHYRKIEGFVQELIAKGIQKKASEKNKKNPPRTKRKV